MKNYYDSWQRLLAIIIKEFIQMRRDRMTFAMLLGVPLLQLLLFGFAINADPKNLPTAIIDADQSQMSRSILAAISNTGYFDVVAHTHDERISQQLLKKGDVQFVISIPPSFTRDITRSQQPSILVEVDGTDPTASSFAVATIRELANNAITRELRGPIQQNTGAPAFNVVVHSQYNPERITQYNIVPGLLGVVLTMTMVIITTIAITRERERGTMENLLATPAKPFEVTVGKIIPYIFVGYAQVSVILLAAIFVFHIPIAGNLLLLYAVCLPFIAANLTVGLTFSTLAKNQLQAMQAAVFFFLPSILLSGFMFPFRGMPEWAQWVGSVLPLTHFLVIVRGIILKGNDFTLIWPQLWPILVFISVMLLIALSRYKQTID